MPISRLVIALAATAALAACSSDPEPRVAPTETPSVSTEPTAQPTIAPLPDLDPEETVRAWVEARNRLLLDGEAGPVRDLSSTDCVTCENSFRPLIEVHKAEGEFRTRGWRVASTRLRSESSARAVVGAALVIPGGETVPRAGATPVAYRQEKRIVLVSLRQQDANWLVNKLVYLS